MLCAELLAYHNKDYGTPLCHKGIWLSTVASLHKLYTGFFAVPAHSQSLQLSNNPTLPFKSEKDLFSSSWEYPGNKNLICDCFLNYQQKVHLKAFHICYFQKNFTKIWIKVQSTQSYTDIHNQLHYSQNKYKMISL